MPTGRLKSYNHERGYGFIVPDEGGPDVFLHRSAIRGLRLSDLVPGVSLFYQPAPNPNGKGVAAREIAVVRGEAG
jgi:CspA family cold shock protein